MGNKALVELSKKYQHQIDFDIHTDLMQEIDEQKAPYVEEFEQFYASEIETRQIDQDKKAWMEEEFEEIYTAGLSYPGFFWHRIKSHNSSRFMDKDEKFLSEIGFKKSIFQNYFTSLFLYRHCLSISENSSKILTNYYQEFLDNTKESIEEDKELHYFRNQISLVFAMLSAIKIVGSVQLESILRMIYDTYFYCKNFTNANRNAVGLFHLRQAIKKPSELLVKLIEKESTDQKCRDLMIKILLILSIITKSYDVMLRVYNLVRKYSPSLDLSNELNKDLQFKFMLTSRSIQNDKIKKEIEPKMIEDTQLNLNNPLKNYDIIIED